MHNKLENIINKVFPIIEWIQVHIKLTFAITLLFGLAIFLMVNTLRFSLSSETIESDPSMIEGQEIVIDENAIERGESPRIIEILEAEDKTLSIDLLSTNIILENDSGFTFETLAVDETLNTSAKRAQRSPFSIIYMYEGWEVGKRLDAYNHSINDSNYTIEKIPNGVRVNYNLTISTPSLTWMPQRISEALYEELSDLTDTSGQIALSQIYTRSSGATNYSIVSSASQAIVDRIYDLWYVEYGLDYDELFELNEQFNIRNRFIERPDFTIPVEYTIDDGDLQVRVVSHAIKEESLEFEKGRSLFITELDLHSGLHAQPIAEDSFIFVPDGSGAIINLDQPQTYYTRYQKSIYDNRSHLSSEIKTMDFQENITMPIFGIASQEASVLGIIENGAEQTRLQVRRASSAAGYNAIYPTIQYRYRDVHSIISGVEIDIYSDFLNQQDYVLRYKIIDNDNKEPNYMDFVNSYQDYLFDDDELTIEPNILLEFYGAFNKKEHFLGIPHNTAVALTTYTQAHELINHFDTSLSSGLHYSYQGAFEGGIHHAFPTNLKHEPALGTVDEFNLLEHQTDNSIYFGLDFFNVYQNRSNGFVNRTHGMRMIGDYTRTFYPYAYNTLQLDETSNGSFYRLSPRYLNSTLTRFNDKNDLNTSSLSVGDMGNTFTADFGRTPMSPADSFDVVETGLNYLNDDYGIMMNNPFIRYVSYGDFLENLPVRSSQEKIFDYDIPFLQLVYQGKTNYTLKSINFNNSSESETLMKAIETNSALKYSLSYENTQITKDSEVFSYLFNTDYRNWKALILEHDKALNSHYEMVDDPFIVDHSVINEHITSIEYRSGEMVLFNYSAERTYKIGEDNILPQSFVLLEGEE